MAQIVELSDALVSDARLVAENAHRSIASQIEFWARLGRAVDLALRPDPGRPNQRGEPRSLSECLASIDSEEGRARLADHLASEPYPHFESVHSRPGLFVKVDEDGTRVVGKFVGREFKPLESE